MDTATMDRIQQLIDDEATARFPADAVPRLALLRHGDHPVIEPGEFYLRVVLGRDGPARLEGEYFDRLEELRAQRLPEVKGFIVTTEARDAAGRRPTGIMKMDGISLLDGHEDEVAHGLTAMPARLGPADTGTLDTLITAGIAANRSEAVRWALARVREQPAYAELSQRARDSGEVQARATLDRDTQDRRQAELDERVKEIFPAGEVQRVALLQHGDDPWVPPGDLLVRVIIAAAGEDPPLPAWERDHETANRELRRELAAKVPAARHLQFWFGGETGPQGRSLERLPGSPERPGRGEGDLSPVDIGFGPADLDMVDTLIMAGAAASRPEAVGWVLARIRERPAYARLAERARELDELKARF